jgi:hypothetical protein
MDRRLLIIHSPNDARGYEFLNESKCSDRMTSMLTMELLVAASPTKILVSPYWLPDTTNLLATLLYAYLCPDQPVALISGAMLIYDWPVGFDFVVGQLSRQARTTTRLASLGHFNTVRYDSTTHAFIGRATGRAAAVEEWAEPPNVGELPPADLITAIQCSMVL